MGMWHPDIIQYTPPSLRTCQVARARVDELNLNQIKAFEILFSWYKNRAIIQVPNNAKPIEYLRMFLHLIAQMDDKQMEIMMRSLEDIAMGI